MKDKIQLPDTIIKVIAEVIQQSPSLTYHNAYHALDVWNAARQYALMENISFRDKAVLEPAALLHDIIYFPGATDNEEKSAEYANNFLTNIYYPYAQEASELILATKWPTNPKNKLEMILCDGDLNNLGRKDFFEKNENLRLEGNITDCKAWYKHSIEFLEKHEYYTISAKTFLEKGKQENLQKLYGMMKNVR
jgi:predicted metal-dependent HD superfamily phosphohydrolase